MFLTKTLKIIKKYTAELENLVLINYYLSVGYSYLRIVVTILETMICKMNAYTKLKRVKLTKRLLRVVLT